MASTRSKRPTARPSSTRSMPGSMPNSGRKVRPAAAISRGERPHLGEDVDGVDQVHPGAQGRPADPGLKREGSRSMTTAGLAAMSRRRLAGIFGVDMLTADLVAVTPFLHVAAQGRQVAVGGDDAPSPPASPQVVQRRLALHAHAQEKDVHRALPGDASPTVPAAFPARGAPFWSGGRCPCPWRRRSAPAGRAWPGPVFPGRPPG